MPSIKKGSSIIPFRPKEGRNASYYDKTSDIYYDVEVKEIRRGQFCKVQINGSSEIVSCTVGDLERPMDEGVNERFEFFEELTRLVVNKDINSLLVTGEGGIGKDFTINSILGAEEFEEEVDYVRVKGHCTPLALFQLLADNSDKLIIFSDCDSVLEDSTSLNILKGVLDTYDRRFVKWLSTKSSGRDKTFEFKGSAIFLSNKKQSSIDGALLSRSVVVDLYMTPKEKIERIRHILPTLDVGTELRYSEKEKVLDLLDRYKNTINNLNLRTFIKGLQVYTKTKNMALVRYQLLNS